MQIIAASLSDNTYKQYSSALKQWWDFCNAQNQDPYDAEEKIVLRFLTTKFQEGAAYGSINNYRSAIALINKGNKSNSHIVNRFFKGIYRLRPNPPKYNSTWDINIVLKELESWFPNQDLDIHKLTCKLVTLIALGSGFRAQSIALISLEGIGRSQKGVEIKIKDLIKTSRAGANQPYAFFPFFQEKPALCIATTILHYLEITSPYRGNFKRLFLSLKKPYKEVGTQTISRWIKEMLRESGVEEIFSAHSTRHASTSMANKRGLSINIIKNSADWSEGSTVFSKFYNRPILDIEQNFAKVVFSA